LFDGFGGGQYTVAGYWEEKTKKMRDNVNEYDKNSHYVLMSIQGPKRGNMWS
jgi:hypothetical protein